MKTCKVCKQNKPLDDFTICRLNKDGRVAKCKPCMAEYHRARYHKVRDIAEGVFNVDQEMRYLALDLTPVQQKSA